MKMFCLNLYKPIFDCCAIELAQIHVKEMTHRYPSKYSLGYLGEKVCYDLLQGKELKNFVLQSQKPKSLTQQAKTDILIVCNFLDRHYEIKNNEISCWDKQKKKKFSVFISYAN